MSEDKYGFLVKTIDKNEALLLTTENGLVEIRIRDSEKRPLKTRVAIRAPKTVAFDTILATLPKITNKAVAR